MDPIHFEMSRITNTDELFRHASRVRDLVVLITGQAISEARVRNTVAGVRVTLYSHTYVFLQVVVLEQVDMPHGRSQRMGSHLFVHKF